MQYQRIRTCPRCKQKYNEYPAISRVDDKTLICPDCGTRESIEQFAAARKQQTIGGILPSMQLKTFRDFDLAHLEDQMNQWLNASALISSEIVSMQYASTIATKSGHSATEYTVAEYSVVILYRATPTAVEG